MHGPLQSLAAHLQASFGLAVTRVPAASNLLSPSSHVVWLPMDGFSPREPTYRRKVHTFPSPTHCPCALTRRQGCFPMQELDNAPLSLLFQTSICTVVSTYPLLDPHTQRHTAFLLKGSYPTSLPMSKVVTKSPCSYHCRSTPNPVDALPHARLLQLLSLHRLPVTRKYPKSGYK